VRINNHDGGESGVGGVRSSVEVVVMIME